MRKSVEEAWIGFSTRFEGRIQWMYLDILGLVTTGIGNLIDPKPAALSLPWRHVGTYERATVGEISVEWDMMKSRKGLAQTGAKAAGLYAKLILPNADIDELVLAKLHTFEKVLKTVFPKWEEFPADAQLGILSMAWAMGPGFTRKFSTFTKLCNEGDWMGASKACTINSKGNPGIVPRNKANADAFMQAHIAKITMGDLNVLRSI